MKYIKKTYSDIGIVKNYEASEDITQEVFIRIKKYCKSYKPSNSARTWLYTIAINTSFTYIKNNQTEIASQNDELYAILDKYNIVENEDRITIQQYLTDLNDEERNIVILNIFAGLKHY